MGRKAVGVFAVVILAGGCAERAAGADVSWRGSIEAGTNLSKWHPTGPGPFGESTSGLYSTFVGFYVGGSVAVPFRFMSVRSGLAFSRRGTEIPGDPETVRVDYLELPFLVELRPPTVLGVQPSVLGCPVSKGC